MRRTKRVFKNSYEGENKHPGIQPGRELMHWIIPPKNGEEPEGECESPVADHQ
jgi:hypothetical protein